MKAKVVEIFSSIQGEGKYTGIPQIFVRFFECNMHCVWCDTPQSIGDTSSNFQEWGPEELRAEVKFLSKGCHSVSLTGGEPLVQKDFLKEFLPLLQRDGLRCYLETNGTLPEALTELIDDIDMIAMDIKLPSSTQQKAFWQEHQEFLSIGRCKDIFIKTVISHQTQEEDIIKAAELVQKIDPHIVFILQPNYLEMRNGLMARCLEYQKLCSGYLSQVRVMPQMHKLMKLR